MTSKLTYDQACAAMQAGVTLSLSLGGNELTPKHLRVGVNAAMADHGALARLMIAKGVFTEQEYLDALAEGMRREVASYEADLSERLGKRVTLGFDMTIGRGCATIEGGQPCGTPMSGAGFVTCSLQVGHDGPHMREPKGSQQ